MPAPIQKVEVGFDLQSSPVFFTLDDSVKGVLDNTAYTLGGRVFYDITSDVKAISYRRGKNRFDDTYTAGNCSIQLNNQDRTYDPTYTGSPYYGQIIPKRRLRVWSNQRNEVISSVTNLVLNGSGEVNTSNVIGRGSVTLATTNAFALYGSNSFIVTTTGVGQSAGIRANHYMPVTANNTFTGSAWFRTDNNTGVQYFVRLIWYNASFASLSFTDGTAVAGSSSWQRISNTSTAPTGAAWVVMDVMTLNFVPSGREIYFDGLMFNAGAIDNYFDGSFNGDSTTTYSWSGTAFNSTSTRQITELKGQVFDGWIDDWNLSYSPGNDSQASAFASDGFGALANQTLPATTNTAQLPGERINAILNLPDVNWDATKRSIDAGLTQLGADTVTAETNVLSYLQRIEQTEQGALFVAKNGNLRFIQRNSITPAASAVVFADDGTGIKYQDLQVVYGSELLYNQTIVSTVFGVTVQADQISSQQEYGVATLNYTDMLHANTDDAINMAYWTVAKYNQPRYRFEALTVVLDNLSTSVQNQLLGIELGDTVKVRFTPSSIPPAIEKYAEVIGITSSSTPNQSTITFTLSTYGVGEFVLNDDNFGRLDSDNGLAY